MKSRNNKRGFTLLEIMIVVIIVGVLAALALPRLFGTIEYSRSTEAFSAITSIRSSMERCYLESRDFQVCDFSNLDIPNPETSPGAHFSYVINTEATGLNYQIVGTRNSLDGGITTDTVGITQEANTIKKCGTGSFKKLGGACPTL